MNVVIVEDERPALEMLVEMLHEYDPSLRVLACLESVKGAVQWLSTHPFPDLIFCDIHLTDGNSFEIFSQVPVKSPVIFTTAYNQYAIQAFKVNSVDYLLKPFDKQSLARALQKLSDLSKAAPLPDLADVQHLMDQLQAKPAASKSRFLVKTGPTIRYVPTADIAYFYAEEKVVFLVTNANQKYIIDFTLDGLKPLLNPERFFRINRQFLVHIHAIQTVKPYFKGRLLVHLLPHSEVDVVVSSEKASLFREWLEL
ncbi:MAG: response regulator transcription factor [Ferruginibacter sp.]|nr:response regulator transcription factor [Cytophagales bacterium]